MTDVAELAKRSSVSWVVVDGEPFVVWHEWVETERDGVAEGAICVVSSEVVDGSEQHLPTSLLEDRAVRVLLRSKSERELVAEVEVTPEWVEPGSDLWEPITAALKAGRLNAADPSSLVERWARECRVARLVPKRVLSPRGESVPRTTPRLS